MRDPILATTTYTERGRTYRIQVKGGLHYIRGNSAPYFSITADIDMSVSGGWREDSGGCCHDEIERRFPGRFTDLIAMHLSDINGAPMHFEGNGWYQLAGALGGAGEQYHAGNQQYRDNSPEACLASFAKHCRIALDVAQTIAEDVRAEFGPESEAGPVHTKADYKRGRAKWAAIAATMQERHAREAKDCIARHGLVVYGDEWEQK